MSNKMEPIGFMIEPIEDFFDKNIELPENQDKYSDNSYSNKKDYSKKHYKILTTPSLLKKYVKRYRGLLFLAYLMPVIFLTIAFIAKIPVLYAFISITYLPYTCLELPNKIFIAICRYKIVPKLVYANRSEKGGFYCYTLDKNLNLISIIIPEIFEVKYEKDEVLIQAVVRESEEKILVSPFIIFAGSNACYDYMSQQIQHRKNAFNNALYNLVDRANFEILVNNDPKAKEVEFTYQSEKYLTTPQSIKDFLNYAIEIIPQLIQKSEDIEEDTAYYKSLANKVEQQIGKF